MFEEVLPQKAQTLLKSITPVVKREGFYLAGGTGLALQIGHRISEDLDFFSSSSFDTTVLFSLLRQVTLSSSRVMEERNTLWTLMDDVRTCFFFYEVPLVFPPVTMEGLSVADWRDIFSEKFKTLSQRGSKKDFFDIYCTMQAKKVDVGSAVSICRRRFDATDLNFYHVLRSLTYFEDAEGEPDPLMLANHRCSWGDVKTFFIEHIKEFQKSFTTWR
jgi:predicted nucleotidyltransferase component of viral defense system